MRRLSSVAAVLLFTGAAACSSAPSNPLIGKWKSVLGPGQTQMPYCPTPMVFTAKTQTLTWGGTPSTENATYVAAQTKTYPTTVYVLGNSANHTTYDFESRDRLRVVTAANCWYQRQ